ncbi:hypothetical protein Agub_g8476 [Astrephomene gubernaculifera]|uniref:Uncharacterized protein n=1 Tax=Astrephomene gubernaculifera TaxID=47775 RepID=A0AAD3DUG0_9CHLO|nr:hypothetical protein Agub_g8476 [Astrephomene gubernaculifera]
MKDALTHYQVLGVSRDVTPEQLKQAYHAAVLKHHPDKTRSERVDGADAASTCEGAVATAVGAATFQVVQKAWEVLRDSGRRAAYDSELSLKEMQQPMSYQDELTLDEMDTDCQDGQGELIYTYPCRCGDQYVLHKSEMANHSTVVVPCRTCSNHVLVRMESP